MEHSVCHELSIKMGVAVGHRSRSFIAQKGFQFSLPFWCRRGLVNLNPLTPARASRWLPGARRRKSPQVRHIWSTKAGQMSGHTPANVTGMCFLTQMTSLRFLLLSPLGEQQGRDDGKQRSSALSSPTPSHYVISLPLPVIPLQLPAFNPAPVFSAYKAKPGASEIEFVPVFWSPHARVAIWGLR